MRRLWWPSTNDQHVFCNFCTLVDVDMAALNATVVLLELGPYLYFELNGTTWGGLRGRGGAKSYCTGVLRIRYEAY